MNIRDNDSMRKGILPELYSCAR